MWRPYWTWLQTSATRWVGATKKYRVSNCVIEMEFFPLNKRVSEKKTKNTASKPQIKKCKDNLKRNIKSPKISVAKKEDNHKRIKAPRKKIENSAPSPTNGSKNRLFVKTRGVILNESLIKDLHPDIIAIRLPRKKRSRWCWAIFETEEKAQGALKKLHNKKDVIVSARSEKSATSKKMKSMKSQTKKLIKEKIRDSWM